MMKAVLLRRIEPDEALGGSSAIEPFDDATLNEARSIVADVRLRGIEAVREYASRFDERAIDEPLVLDRTMMDRALITIAPRDRAVLERTAERIWRFARAQRDAICALQINLPGGRCGHSVEPVNRAGCYAPAGRYPLPSSVLMTAVTARVAGCESVVVATPGAHPMMLAAAAIAGADEVLAVGGAHAVAAMAFGMRGFSRCDVVVGPGNAWVTAAKACVSGVCGIDMLAGPSELLIIADASADPEIVAADLLAQAEHDVRARPMLIALDESVAIKTEQALTNQLQSLPTRDVAAQALRNGWVCIVRDEQQAAEVANAIAPEHLEILTSEPAELGALIRSAGAMFLGASSAEVFGDYGAGPNHTLPTGGTARFASGLSVQHFLRLRTWLSIDRPQEASVLIQDAIRLAELEGLAGHAASARLRSGAR